MSITTHSHPSDPSRIPGCGRSAPVLVHISHVSAAMRKEKNATTSFTIPGKEDVSVICYRWFSTSTRQLTSKKAPSPTTQAQDNKRPRPRGGEKEGGGGKVRRSKARTLKLPMTPSFTHLLKQNCRKASPSPRLML